MKKKIDDTTEMAEVKLTAKQQRFCDEYLIDLNGAQAAIRVGYSTNTAKEQASQLLTKLNIRSYIDQKLAERSRRTGITQDRVLQELARIAFVKPTDVIDFKTGSIKEGASEDDLAVIAGTKVKKSQSTNGEMVEREVKLTDKLKALELCGKHLGMFGDKLDISGEMNINVNIEE